MKRFAILTLASLALVLAVSVGARANGWYNEVVHDAMSGTVVHNTDGNCVITRWLSGRDGCGGSLFISEDARTVYFPFNSSHLTWESRHRLNTLAGALRANGIREVQLVGFADRMGNPVYNERLSRRRAETVRHYLVAHGIVHAGVVKTRWMGESSPTTNCPAHMKRRALIRCLAGDRRVEIEINYNNVASSRDYPR